MDEPDRLSGLRAIPPSILLAVESRLLRQGVTRCLEAIGLSWRLRNTPLVREEEQGAALVLITDGEAPAARPGTPGSGIWIRPGSVTDTVLVLDEGRAKFVSVERLTVGALFTAIYEALLRDDLHAHLMELLAVTAGVVALVDLSAEEPSRALTLHDMASGLTATLGAAARELRELGFDRDEHLLAYVRAESWCWLVGLGVSRRVVEALVGIPDRSNFRRACRRAGVRVPQHRKSSRPLTATHFCLSFGEPSVGSPAYVFARRGGVLGRCSTELRA